MTTTLLGGEAGPSGEQARAGGWGQPLGDEGSGCAVVGDGVRRELVL